MIRSYKNRRGSDGAESIFGDIGPVRSAGSFSIDDDQRIVEANCFVGQSPFAERLRPGIELSELRMGSSSHNSLIADSVRNAREEADRVDCITHSSRGNQLLVSVIPLEKSKTPDGGEPETLISWCEKDDRYTCLEEVLDFCDFAWWLWDLRTDEMQLFTHGQCVLGYGENDWTTTGEFWKERLHPDDKEEVLRDLAQFTDGKKNVWEGEHRLARGDKTQLTFEWVQERAKALDWDGAGHPTRAAGLCRTIHERKIIESEFIETHERLVSALNNRQEFLTGMNHEIRTPLNAVSGIVQLLSMDTGESPTTVSKDDLQLLQSACQDLEKALVYASAHSDAAKQVPAETSGDSIAQIVGDVARTTSWVRDPSDLEICFPDNLRIETIRFDTGLVTLGLEKLLDSAKFMEHVKRLIRVDVLGENTGKENYLVFRFVFRPAQALTCAKPFKTRSETDQKTLTANPTQFNQENATKRNRSLEVCREVARSVGGWVATERLGEHECSLEFALSL